MDNVESDTKEQGNLTNTNLQNIEGDCGTHATWELELEHGGLTIRGTGTMTDWTEEDLPPWRNWADAIRTVTVKEGVTTIGDYAFADCVNLSGVFLARSVEILGTYSFCGCASLEDIAFSEGMRVIGAKAFEGCSSLASVHLPISLQNIDMKAFNNTDSLRNVFYSGTKRQWNRILISQAAMGNDPLLSAVFHCQEPSGVCLSDTEEIPPHSGRISAVDRYEELTALVREVLKRGGNGRMYILPVSLYVPGVPGKSGDCTLIIFPDGRTMMIDAGHPECVEHILSLLDALELRELDYFVTSHPHLDHVGGAKAVADYFYDKGGAIGTYCASPLQFKTLEPALVKYLKEKGTRIVKNVLRGDQWTIGSVNVDVMNPSEEEVLAAASDDGGVNNVSVALRFRFGDSSYLSCGDLYKSKEQILVNMFGKRLCADVMKCNHHGAYTSNGSEWLKAVSPQITFAIADCIGGTVLSERAADLGIAYYSTGVDGLIVIEMGDSRDYRVLTQYDTVLRKK